MKREERNELAANVLSHALDRESNLPPIDRFREACGAMLDVFVTHYKATQSPAVLAQIEMQQPPIVLDEIKDAGIVRQAMPVLRQVAAAHNCEVRDLLGSWREFIIARDEACWTLAKETRLKQQDVGNLFGLTQSAVSVAIKRHRERAASVAITPRRAASGS